MKKSFYILIIVFLLGAISLVIFNSLNFKRSDLEKFNDRFDQDVYIHVFEFEKEISTQQSILYSMRDILNLPGSTISHNEFINLTSSMISRDPAIAGLGYIPKINFDNKEKFIREIQRFVGGYSISEISHNNKIIPAKEKDYYFPVYLSVEKESLLHSGLDLDSDILLHKELTEAALLDTLVFTYNPVLFPYSNDKTFFISLLPVYEGQPQRPEERLASIKGYLYLVSSLDAIMAQNLLANEEFGIILSIWISSDNGSQMIYTSEQPDDKILSKKISRDKKLLSIGKNSIVIVAYPGEQLLKNYLTIMPKIFFLLGIIIIVSLSTLIYFFAQRSANVEKLVISRTKELNELNETLKSLSYTDGLTKIPNRRHFNIALKAEWRRAIRNKSTLTLFMMDIDYFKKYNDTYGHLAGDKCLVSVAAALAECISRPGDLLARYGGEEFALILPETTESAVILGERCRSAIENLAIPHSSSLVIDKVTISVGMTTIYPDSSMTSDDLIKKADNALYLSKEQGRNRIVQI